MTSLKVKQQRYNADLQEFRKKTNKPNWSPDTGSLIASKTDKEFTKFQKSQKTLRKSRAKRVDEMAKTFKRPTYT